MDPLKLLDACASAYDQFHEEKDGQTFCNFAVQAVAKIYAYAAFDGLVANQMIDLMAASPDWQSVHIADAQALANAGRWVIAGAKDDPHGHVVTIRPGMSDYSDKWQMNCPKVCHCGHNSFFGRSLAWAFPGTTVPQLWVYKGQ